MRPLLLILLSVIVFVPSVAHAKRKAAPKVEPIIYEAMRYAAPNDDGRRTYLQAWDIKANRMVWEITVFRNLINPLLEEDVQHVYINKMSIREGKLILIAEDDRAYSVDLKMRAVKRLKQPPAEKPQANHALQRKRRALSRPDVFLAPDLIVGHAASL